MKTFTISWSNSLLFYLFLENIFSSYSVNKITPKKVNKELIVKFLLENQIAQADKENIQSDVSNIQDLANNKCELACPPGSKITFYCFSKMNLIAVKEINFDFF